MKYKKYINFLIFSIPLNHLHYKLEVAPPDFNYDIDIFYSILNDLSQINYYESYETNNYMIPLAAKYLKMKYGNKYNKYIQYLVVYSIIGRSGYSNNNCSYYTLNHKLIEDLLIRIYSCSSYCCRVNSVKPNRSLISTAFEQKEKEVKKLEVVNVPILKSGRLGKKICLFEKRERDKIKHGAKHIQQMEKFYYANIGIDVAAASAYTDNLFNKLMKNAKTNIQRERIFRKIQQRNRSIKELKDGLKGGLLQFHRNSTNRRIDTNLTRLASDMRPFLKGFDKMSYIDLSNSQPVLFNILLKTTNRQNAKLQQEIQEYANITLSGKWYEFLGELYGEERNKAKTLWMLIAYSENNKHLRRKGRFTKRFPEISKVIEKYKQKEYENFAIQLQKIESRIFIDEICKDLVLNNVFPYTLHDSVLFEKGKELEVYKILANVFLKHLGTVPVMTLNSTKVFSIQDISIG